MVKLHSHSSMCVHVTVKIFPETQNTFLNNNNSKIKTATFKRLKQNQTLYLRLDYFLSTSDFVNKRLTKYSSNTHWEIY